MLILTLLHKACLAIFHNLVLPVYVLLYRLFADVRAYNNKKRSEFQLEQLDDYLLDDIGLRRVGDEILPLRKAVNQSNDIGRQRQKRRLRHAYLFRRRRLNNSR